MTLYIENDIGNNFQMIGIRLHNRVPVDKVRENPS